jgi:acyl carrier protein
MNEETTLRTYLRERFGNYRDDMDSEESLEGVVDSLGLFELVEFLERKFQLKIPNHEFSPRRFHSIGNILETVAQFRS